MYTVKPCALEISLHLEVSVGSPAATKVYPLGAFKSEDSLSGPVSVAL